MYFDTLLSKNIKRKKMHFGDFFLMVVMFFFLADGLGLVKPEEIIHLATIS